jgi:23S rRNA (cytidine2498-2'-O)-methyltransferase
VSINNLCIVTAHPEFLQPAIEELRALDPEVESIDELAAGITLCMAADASALMQRAASAHLVFTRHLAPVQEAVSLNYSEKDMGKIALAIAELPAFRLLERGIHFAVQTRFARIDKERGPRPYSGGQLNQALAEAFAEETGAIEDIKKPEVIVSILCTMTTAYIGISKAEENLSAWPGGARHYAQTPDQISRAEFKLLEALEYFGISLPARGKALDLGAAPGGWTHILLDAGLSVVAVDPANLDPRVNRPGLTHYRGYAERYLEEAIQRRSRFDLIVNDMRMDAREAARLLNKAAGCLRPDGFIISVLKLPHRTDTIDPQATLNEALKTLRRRYALVQVHQLFHNRQEVTAVAAQPIKHA